MTKVSVVIPLYNKEKYIERAILSVLSQTDQDFEIIVVDDGSIDNGPNIVKSFKDIRIHLIQQKNTGVSVARNRGIKESKTDFITFLDADDEWTPNFLETIYRLKIKYPEAGAYTTHYIFCDPCGKIINIKYKKIPPAPWEGLLYNYFQIASLGQYLICSSCVGIPKKIFSELGYFQEGVCLGEDLDMWGRIALKYPIAFSWNVGAIYHREAENRACDTKIITEQYYFVKKANEAIQRKEVSEEVLGDLSEYITYLQIKTAISNVLKGNSKEAYNILKNCSTKYSKKTKFIWTFLALIPTNVFNIIYYIRRKL